MYKYFLITYHIVFLLRGDNIDKIFNNRKELYLELSLIINKKMYESKTIPYHVYKISEEKILQMIDRDDNNGSIYHSS